MRLFVAVNLPEPTRRAVAAATAALRCADLPVRWVEPDAYHLTLAFLGEVEAAAGAAIGSALERAAAARRRFTIRLDGAGAFPDVRRPAVFWLGVSDAAPLLELQHAVAAELAPLGFPGEARPFQPHLTLGRTRRDARAGSLRNAAALLQDVAFDETLDVETVDLMRSQLSSRGARYERVLAAALAA